MQEDFDEEIPLGAREFYHSFGPLLHPRTGKLVEDLTDYQYRIWDDKSKYRLVVKSQKVGLSTSCLLEDFQKALTVCKGRDILLIAQTQDQANEHLLTLKTLIINSEKYRKYLITDASDMLFKEEKTKLSEVFIKNPENTRLRTRIIGKGPSEAALWSWKNVAHIHMSDIAANKLKDDSPVFAAAFSRLATTNGTMLIETPPRGPFKRTFDIYQQSIMQQKDPNRPATMFSVHHVEAREAVKAGIVEQEFLDGERERLGPTLYAQSYECQFTALTGNLFSQASIDLAVNRPYSLDFREITEKYIVCDVGYSTSLFAILIAELVHKPVKRIQILKAEEHQSPDYEEMIDLIKKYRESYGHVVNIGIDATSRMEVAMSLKGVINVAPPGMPEEYESNHWPYVKKLMDDCKKEGGDISRRMFIVPIIFTQDSKAYMSSHARRILDDRRELVAIDPKFNNLITGLRSAVFDEKGMLDKDLTPHDDLVDCFMMLMTFFHFKT